MEDKNLLVLASIISYGKSPQGSLDEISQYIMIRLNNVSKIVILHMSPCVYCLLQV